VLAPGATPARRQTIASDERHHEHLRAERDPRRGHEPVRPDEREVGAHIEDERAGGHGDELPLEPVGDDQVARQVAERHDDEGGHQHRQRGRGVGELGAEEQAHDRSAPASEIASAGSDTRTR
jgi:hypothetical protein